MMEYLGACQCICVSIKKVARIILCNNKQSGMPEVQVKGEYLVRASTAHDDGIYHQVSRNWVSCARPCRIQETLRWLSQDRFPGLALENRQREWDWTGKMARIKM